MKHIKVKNTEQYEINFHPSELDSVDVPQENKEIGKRLMNSNEPIEDWNLIAMLDDCVVFGFDYPRNEEKLFIPELDPVVIYFSNAQMSSWKLSEYRKVMLDSAPDLRKMGKDNKTVGGVMKNLETFFQFASSSIIMLHASLEAFSNKVIPSEFEYTTTTGRKKGVEWILKHATLEQKIGEMLPEIFDKSFHVDKSQKYEQLLEVKNFRNELIHLKPKTAVSNTRYKEFYRKVIDFPYDMMLSAVRDYINYYQPNLIEECNCGRDIYFDVQIDDHL